MSSVTKSLFAVISLTSFLVIAAYGVEPPKQTNGRSATTSASGKEPVHLVVRSRADIKQIFSYSPYPAVPSELEGFAGSQVAGAATYRLSVDAQGAVTQVAILKGFSITEVYDERVPYLKGNPVPALDKVMVQALTHWRAKPGPMRIVDVYWSFGSRPGVNYGRSNGSE
jgi:hypothetical protein